MTLPSDTSQSKKQSGSKAGISKQSSPGTSSRREEVSQKHSSPKDGKHGCERREREMVRDTLRENAKKIANLENIVGQISSHLDKKSSAGNSKNKPSTSVQGSSAKKDNGASSSRKQQYGKPSWFGDPF